MNKQKSIFYLLTPMIFLFGCQFTNEVDKIKVDEGNIETLVIPENFRYNTSREVTVNINFAEETGNVVFEILDQEKNLLSSGNVNNEIDYDTKLSLPTSQDSIWVVTKTMGFVAENGIEILNDEVNFTFSKPTADENLEVVDQSNTRTSATSYQTLGSWDTQGRPQYLEAQSDVISQQFLDDISASLPESRPVPEYNAQYLTEEKMNTELQEEADIWVTFVHEGAGWKNTLGYYTYDINNPPSSIEEIDNHYIIFPNVSYTGSGGNLKSGDKVHLGRFPANTGIGWFLIPNAWDAGSATVQNKSKVKYSVKQFNNFTDAAYAQHVILLKDNVRELILLGIEDTSRPSGDNDFNDAVFYVTANPYTAVITTNFLEVTESKDTDNDGILDHLDDYPNDPTKAFTKYIPAKDIKGSLAFEDFWPSKGDYDFNDLVLDYHYKEAFSASNRIQKIEADYTIQAIGGYYHNGFGVSLPFSSNVVESITGNLLNGKYVVTEANGTESGHENAVVIIFEDAYDVMRKPAGATLVNARDNEPYVEPVMLNVVIDLTDDIVHDREFTEDTIDPFLIVNQNRGHEIHLPGKKPTNLIDTSLLGTDSDDSNPNLNRFYLTQSQLPWAINLARKFDYPKENIQINKAHSNFSTWAETGGSMFRDWYENKQGYRKGNLIYQR